MKHILIGIMVLMLTGCVSHTVLQNSKHQVGMRKAIAANNDFAIQALKNGASPSVAGISVTAWEAVKENPLLQTGAAIADGLIIWGGYEGVQWLSEQDGSGSGQDSVTAGRDGTIIEVNGDGNTVQVRGDESNIGGSEEELE